MPCFGKPASFGPIPSLAPSPPPQASLSNPVDMIASAGPDHYRQSIATLLATDEIDALVIIYIPVDMSQRQIILDAIRAGITAGRVARGAGKPGRASLLPEGGRGS